MGPNNNFCGELSFRPIKADYSLKIPLALRVIGTQLHDHDILGPADLHGLSHERIIAFIGTEELPHPAHITGGEASDVRIFLLQVF